MLQERQKGQKPTQVQRRYDANLIIFAHFFVEPSTSTSSTLTTTLRSCNCLWPFQTGGQCYKELFWRKNQQSRFPPLLELQILATNYLKNEAKKFGIFNAFIKNLGGTELLFVITSGHIGY